MLGCIIIAFVLFVFLFEPFNLKFVNVLCVFHPWPLCTILSSGNLDLWPWTQAKIGFFWVENFISDHGFWTVKSKALKLNMYVPYKKIFPTMQNVLTTLTLICTLEFMVETLILSQNSDLGSYEMHFVSPKQPLLSGYTWAH